MKNYFSDIVTQVQIIIQHSDFKLKRRDPTQDFYCNDRIRSQRQKLIDDVFYDFLSLMHLVPKLKHPRFMSKDKINPFLVEELMVQDEDEDLNMLEGYLLSKNFQELE